MGEPGRGESQGVESEAYGRGHWRKMKGLATVCLTDGTVHTAELHWYEAHGIGRKEVKIKFPLLV